MRSAIYGIRTCDTAEAFAGLDAHGVADDFQDYVREAPPPERLEAWARIVGRELLANTRGTTWRNSPDAAKQGLDERRALALLAANPSAIRRPIVEARGEPFVGSAAAAFARVLWRGDARVLRAGHATRFAHDRRGPPGSRRRRRSLGFARPGPGPAPSAHRAPGPNATRITPCDRHLPRRR